ncbi:MAG: hypothetical protein D3910_21655, partial [Candidatus Electrothrix sp. ATG2]|nr:hypothetical protein [Candidatus Electrothrix sp. ATG2]
MFFLSFSSPHRTHRLLMQSCLFAAFLTYFVFAHAWYEPGRLILHGQSTSGTPLIQVRWNSGAGFNEYEQREFHPKK